MNRRYLPALICFVVFLIVAAWRWPASAPPPKLLVQKFPQNQKEALIVPSNLQWDELAEGELRKFTAHFEQDNSRQNFHWETKVAIGESIVTQGYEGKPGEFVFTRLTPVIRNQKGEATSPLEFDLSTHTIDLFGQERKLTDHSLKMHMMSGGILQGTMYVGASEGNYKIQVKTTNNYQSSNIPVQVTGGFIVRTKKAIINHDD